MGTWAGSFSKWAKAELEDGPSTSHPYLVGASCPGSDQICGQPGKSSRKKSRLDAPMHKGHGNLWCRAEIGLRQVGGTNAHPGVNAGLGTVSTCSQCAGLVTCSPRYGKAGPHFQVQARLEITPRDGMGRAGGQFQVHSKGWAGLEVTASLVHSQLLCLIAAIWFPRAVSQESGSELSAPEQHVGDGGQCGSG